MLKLLHKHKNYFRTLLYTLYLVAFLYLRNEELQMVLINILSFVLFLAEIKSKHTIDVCSTEFLIILIFCNCSGNIVFFSILSCNIRILLQCLVIIHNDDCKWKWKWN